MNRNYLYSVNKHLSSWALLGLPTFFFLILPFYGQFSSFRLHLLCRLQMLSILTYHLVKSTVYLAETIRFFPPKEDKVSKVETIVCNQHIVLFTLCIQKPFSTMVVKTMGCVVIGLIFLSCSHRFLLP